MTGFARSMRRYRRLCQGLNRAVESALFFLGLSMALVVCAQVFFRYLLNDSLFWSEEAARYMLVWLTFLGATSAYHRGAHPRIDTLAAALPPKLRGGARVISHSVSLALFAFMMVCGAQFAHFVRLQISPALGIPQWAVTASVPVSGFILCVHALRLILEEFYGGAGDS